MSNFQYGLINRVDSNLLETCIDNIMKGFPGETINYAEIGLYNGRTTSGLKEYLDSVGASYNLTGIDNFKDKEDLVFYPKEATLIQGSSIEVYNQLPDNSQHLIMIDGNHSFPYVIADYFCYRNKVKVGGYIAFHDASPQTQGQSYQRMGSDKDPDMYIAVMKALTEIGLVDNKIEGWVKVYHDWDENDEGGGTIVFTRTK